MDDKLFIIAIGGTGMRCLESFIHLCAIGMFDNKEIDILTLDTDASNGNKTRTETLIDLYRRVKKDGLTDGGVNADTFFSAKLNLYRFKTDYISSTRNSYATISHLSDSQDDADLAALFLDKDVQEFNLEHGYRAQTQLGSMLMYNSIIEAVRNVRLKRDEFPDYQELDDFIVKIAQAGANARVFVFGSIFGGTGASSIPIIPKAFQDASSLVSKNANKIDSNKVKFGSTLLTQYFTFANPDQHELEKEKVIATSQRFSLNCQAAMQFYQSDPTVAACYRRFYHIGWPEESLDLDSKTILSANHTTKTGGDQQRNDCHVVELMCACAAYDFFYAKDEEISNTAASYLFRCCEHDGNGFKFVGNTFLDDPVGDILHNKLGMLFSLAHLCLGRYGGYKGVSGVKLLIKFIEESGKCPDYRDLQDDQIEALDEYLRQFAYYYDNTSKGLMCGWLYQLNNSVKPGGKFLFRSNAFEENESRLKDVDPGYLFENNQHNWEKSFSFGNDATRRIDTFGKKLSSPESKPNEDKQHVNTLKEKFIAHLYNALSMAQNAFDKK